MAEGMFSGRLLPGERIVWSGRPRQGIVVTGRDVFLVPLGLLWCGFAMFWTFMAIARHAPGLVTLLGLWFVCIGLYFVFGGLLLDAWVRRGMGYALTNRRILIVRLWPFDTFTALKLEHLLDIGLTEQRDGRGTVRFGPRAMSRAGGSGFGLWTPALDPTPQFMMIEDVRHVFDLVQRDPEACG